MRRARPSLGLLGRVVAILLITLVIEFGVSTLLYERASSFSVQEDEANRLAEHLVIARRLVAERPPAARPAIAAELTTERYEVQWRPALPDPPPIAPTLDAMRRQVVAWEPSLGDADLRLRLATPARSSAVIGALRLADGSWMLFRTLEPVAEINLTIERILLALIPAAALMLLGGVAIRRTLLPLRELAAAADRVGNGGPVRVSEDGPGEVRRVVGAFNRMQDRIARLIADRTQALAAVGHDLRTPLARLRLRSDLVDDSEVRAAIARDVDEMDAMVASLLAFLGGEGEPEKPARVDLAVMCETLVDDAADRGFEATYEGPDHCEAVVRPMGLKRAVSNLVENATHYADRFTLTLEPGDEEVSISVEDDGPGIPEDKLAAVVEPFVRLDQARGRDTVGFGLGLAIVAQAAASEGGRLVLANRPERGLSASLILPRGNDSLQSGPSSEKLDR